MLTIKLISKCFQDASGRDDPQVDLLLEENDWNDYYYYTTYHLHVTTKRATPGNKPKYIGPIQIMKLGQQQGEENVLSAALGNEIIFSDLPKNFFSITFSLDVFKGLAEYFNEEERKEFIRAFRLILKETDDYYHVVENDDCFKTYADMGSFYLLKGRELMLQEGIRYNLREKNITIHYANSDTPVTLDFSAVPGMDSELMPNGIVAFIGKNGSGKSTALYKLAYLLYSSPKDRMRYREEFGVIEPGDLGISKLMVFSYSPFDNFILPGETIRQGETESADLKLWADGIENRTGRFIFCGLRDVGKEAERLLDPNKFNNQDGIRMKVTFKEQEKLAEESRAALEKIKSREDPDIREDLTEVLHDMEEGQNELHLSAHKLFQSLSPWTEEDWTKTFLNLSTGHKFFFHTIFHILAYCEENTMLFFDEPENHLQPPLLSFMLKEIRKILSKRKSVMLVATHSPVVLQETLSKNVWVVRKFGDLTVFNSPAIETYGANFGAISSEVFDLTTDRMSFFNAVDEIYSQLGCDDLESADEAVEKVEEHLGGISSQVMQYVISKFVSKDSDDHVEH